MIGFIADKADLYFVYNKLLRQINILHKELSVHFLSCFSICRYVKRGRELAPAPSINEISVHYRVPLK